CLNDSIILFTNENYEILWNNSTFSKSFTIYSSGTYTATYIGDNKCETIKTIVVQELEPQLSATQTTFCEGDSTIISLDKNYEKIVWNTGETTKDIVVKDA